MLLRCRTLAALRHAEGVGGTVRMAPVALAVLRRANAAICAARAACAQRLTRRPAPPDLSSRRPPQRRRSRRTVVPGGGVPQGPTFVAVARLGFNPMSFGLFVSASRDAMTSAFIVAVVYSSPMSPHPPSPPLPTSPPSPSVPVGCAASLALREAAPSGLLPGRVKLGASSKWPKSCQCK
ncbi:Protein of unknown function [Gryllus bimaculatus]|nr:Protein of unknown function [Gryllus bimaculatus]